MQVNSETARITGRAQASTFPNGGPSIRIAHSLGDFEIANCLINADRTHDDGKQSHERPSQRSATADRASGGPNAKGNDTYRDLERECGIHVGLHSKEERSA